MPEGTSAALAKGRTIHGAPIGTGGEEANQLSLGVFLFHGENAYLCRISGNGAGTEESDSVFPGNTGAEEGGVGKRYDSDFTNLQCHTKIPARSVCNRIIIYDFFLFVKFICVHIVFTVVCYDKRKTRLLRADAESRFCGSGKGKS